jgi:hypothetical protein
MVPDLLTLRLVISDRHLPSLGALADELINWSKWLTSPS